VGFVAPNFYDHAFRLLTEMVNAGANDIRVIYSGRHFSAPELQAASELAGRESLATARIRPIDFFPPDAPDTEDRDEEFLNQVLDDMLVKDGLPQVLFCYSDWIAWRAMQYFQTRGICVPDEVGVVGCLGLDLGLTCTPPLTTLSLDAQLMGRKAVTILQTAISNGKPPEIARLPLTYIERESFLMTAIRHEDHKLAEEFTNRDSYKEEKYVRAS